MSLVLDLPWPSPRLSPNARVHWSMRCRATKRYRMDCYLLALDQTPHDLRERIRASDDLPIRIDFYPPDRRTRDDDNLIASFKSGRDGLALAWGIDDRHIRVAGVCLHETPTPNGCVRITVSDGAGSRSNGDE